MKFSVLLPTRNRLELLSRAIETVRRQDYDDWEIIVSDNCSDEDVGGHVQSLGDSRIKYFRTDSFVPVTDNWNNAIEKCTGDYIIMLGDDDGLMKGYFSRLSLLIERFNSPDFIYTNALLYAYPGVLPGFPEGFLRTYRNRRIYHASKEPFWLDKPEAISFVEDSLNFRVSVDYNMQFSLISRKLMERMERYGRFFQSPYPDYYATNAMMLEAERILVDPLPLVTIGISPKSFGYYYFNGVEEDGNEFLNNLPDKDLAARLREIILPGTTMNTSWLFSMETLSRNLGEKRDVGVNYSRYRLIQIISVYSGLIHDNEDATNNFHSLKKQMSVHEWLKYGLIFSAIMKLGGRPLKRYRALCFRLIKRKWGPHPECRMPDIRGEYHTLLDVFDQIDPLHIKEVKGTK